jgi:serine/threonine-protein kinase RsbT
VYDAVVTRAEVRVMIGSSTDIVCARQKGRELALKHGFSSSDSIRIAAAISELARNIVQYAGRGEIILRPVNMTGKGGLEVVAADDGPGVPDVALAMRDGYTTSGGLGMGLPGVRRLMDEFYMRSALGQGTSVTVRKWKH